MGAATLRSISLSSPDPLFTDTARRKFRPCSARLSIPRRCASGCSTLSSRRGNSLDARGKGIFSSEGFTSSIFSWYVGTASSGLCVSSTLSEAASSSNAPDASAFCNHALMNPRCCRNTNSPTPISSSSFCKVLQASGSSDERDSTVYMDRIERSRLLDRLSASSFSSFLSMRALKELRSLD